MTERPAFEPTRAEELGVVQVSAAGLDRRLLLESTLRRLAQELDGIAGHRRSCECRCGVPPDSRTVPTLAKEIREIARELDSLPQLQESIIDELKRKREERKSGPAAPGESASASS
jgi:hypothetical protein